MSCPQNELFMFKKTVQAFAFLSVLTTFYSFNAPFGALASAEVLLDARSRSDCSLLAEGDYVISAYDNLIRSISEQEGHDWRLVSAIAFHESRFRSDLTSQQGARGMMQIMPSVARYFDVPVGSCADPETNVWLANRLLSKIMERLGFTDGVASRDRMSIVLAAYNGGLGHVLDARRLARRRGENPDSWEVVARYLRLKADPAYYGDDAVRCGRFSGSRQTLAYVRDVMGRYDKYCRMTVR